MIATMKHILKTRRRFLQLSASSGLLAPFFNQLQSIAATGQAERRVAFVFFPHGTPETSGFWPGAGPLGSLTGVLEPLAQHKSKMLIVGGLGSGLEKGYGHQGGNTALGRLADCTPSQTGTAGAGSKSVCRCTPSGFVE